MTTYFLFSDSEKWHLEVNAKTWREALAVVRDTEGIGGKLTISRNNDDSRDYKLANTNYSFSLRMVS
jgi:hypothetical protein